MQRHALIAGASIAGPTLAHWLNEYGWRVTIVEQASELREGGQNVDVRGVGVDVLRRMGLYEAAHALRTAEKGTRFIRLDGEIAAELPVDRSDIDGTTAELEILRGDLARIIYDATLGRNGIEYVFGDRIRSVARDGDERIAVEFETGLSARYDLVVAADGLRSSTRDVLGIAHTRKLIGIETTYLTIPRASDDDGWWDWYTAAGGRSVTTRPDPHGTTRATLTEIIDEKDAPPRRTREEQIEHVRSAFADAGWKTPRILEHLHAADDLYYEQLGQIMAPTWGNERGVLVGDAAYCASPLSGMGTTLALIGAYVLAGEVGRHARLNDAFRAYQDLMQPFAERAQKLPLGVPRLTNPSSRFGVKVLNTVLAVVASPLLGGLSDKLFERPANTIDLPHYSDAGLPR